MSQGGALVSHPRISPVVTAILIAAMLPALVVGETVANAGHEERVDWSVIKEKIRLDLKRYIQRETGRRPMIIPVVLEV